MPLRKLWKTLCGGGSVATDAESQPSLPTNPAANDRMVDRADRKPSRRPAESAPPRRRPSRPAVAKSVSREDKRLCRRVESLRPQSILEIGVGDGTRAIALLSGLAQADGGVHYAAIDPFEMAGGHLTLKAFHRMIREQRATAQLVPLPVAAGMQRVLRTVGQVDVIVWSGDQPPSAAEQHLLRRLSKPATIVFSADGGSAGRGSWSEQRYGEQGDSEQGHASVAENTRGRAA